MYSSHFPVLGFLLGFFFFAFLGFGTACLQVVDTYGTIPLDASACVAYIGSMDAGHNGVGEKKGSGRPAVKIPMYAADTASPASHSNGESTMTQAQRDRKAYENSRLGQMHRDEQKQIDASKDADRQRGVNMLVSKE